MDDVLAINVARTAIRDGYNNADFNLLKSVLDADLVNFADQAPCWWGEAGIDSWRHQMESLWRELSLHYTVIIIEIRIMGDTALEYGWQIFEWNPKGGGEKLRRRERYVDMWQRRPEGWRMTVHMTNEDVPMRLASEA